MIILQNICPGLKMLTMINLIYWLIKTQNFYFIISIYICIRRIDQVNIDLRLNKYKLLHLNSNYNYRDMINIYVSFYYHFGRFPGNYNLVHVPKGGAPNFVDTKDVILSLMLYKNFLSEDMRGLLCVQSPAALNIFLGGSSTLLKDVMRELFHSLS